MAVGDAITVNYGEEVFNVGNFQSYRHGPFSMTVTIQPGETDAQAFNRAWTTLESHAMLVFLAKRNAYAERVRAKSI